MDIGGAMINQSQLGREAVEHLERGSRRVIVLKAGEATIHLGLSH